ncbi:hypothetical protein OSH11_21535 [Kaistia dalseonensis]|uniref:Transposase n=1 Tax=Kaistia dalseonensis TaxID=410840 RepID=A0ABU0HEJ6_9HYPH|nr:hypothetical protein [Kaistia dalseonensis]MCX5497294.1 hypothetical protein [Kaistia dalseonensis]MDQ0439931.1 hypothetical protein [Kaistia dalseonensis]
MLSDCIREMRRTFDEYRGSGVEMSPEGVEGHLLKLRALEIEARNMEERLALLAPLRRHEPILPENVVPFRRSP